jgi:LysM repeat protein
MKQEINNMETETPKPQTGGLKLMTVFIVVLALHVVVIGGISAYQLLKRRSGDVANNAATKDQTTETTDVNKPDDSTATAQTDATAPQPSTTGDAQVSTVAPVAPTPQPVEPAPANTNSGSHTSTMVPSQVNPAPLAPTPSPTVAPTHEAKVAPVAPAADKSVAGTIEVTVKPGDSLYKIAKHNHTTVDSIKSLNSLANINLKIGQKLKVAVKGNAPQSAPAPTLAPAAAPVGVTDASVVAKVDKPAFKTTAKLAKEPAAAPVATAAPADAASSAVYTVAKGDTLTKIAKHFNTTTTAIMSANSLTNPGKLSIGAKLKIPSQQARNTVTPETTTPAIQPKQAPAQSSDLVMADHGAAQH